MPKIVQYNLPPGGTVTQIADSEASSLLVEGVDDADYLQIDTTNSAEKVIIAGGGAKVGIGCTPSEVLSISTDGTDQLSLTHDGTDAYFRTDDGSFVFQTDEGTNTNTLVDIKGKGTGNGFLRIHRGASGSYLDINVDSSYAYFTGYRPLYFQTTGDKEILFMPDGTGMVGISEVTPSKLLDLKNGASGGDILCYDIYTHDGGAETSDERQKENIVETVLGLDFVNSLEPVSYKWKDTPEIVESHTFPATDTEPERTDHQVYEAVTYTRTHHGLISQQVKQAVENAGLTDVDFAGYVYDPERDEHRLRYTEFIAPLIKSVQELSTLCQSLAAKVEELESAGGHTVEDASPPEE